MNVNVSLVVLVMAGLLLVYALVHAWQTSRPSRKRSRTLAPATAPGTPQAKSPWIWSAMKKWDTVRSMMKWKAEMASLDDVIQSIEQEARPKGDEKKCASPDEAQEEESS